MAVLSTDQITIVDVTDAYSVILTSEAYTFVGGVNGAASGLTCTTQAVAFCGTNQCSVVTVNKDAIVCPDGISASVSNSGSAAVTITFTTTATISEACEATIPVVVDGITVNKKFSFAVAKTGATGQTGATGKGIKSVTNKYLASTSSSNVTSSTSGWTTTMQATDTSKKYLWCYQIITYTDNSTSETVPAIIGTHGATGAQGGTGATGKGIKSVTNKYLASTANSGVTTSTSGWTDTMQVTDTSKRYLWCYQIITYTDNTTSNTVPAIIGTHGATGATGADAITMAITASNGTVFKNSSGSTVLTAHVFKGGVEQSITDDGVCGTLGTVKWYAGSSTTGVAGKTITVNATSVTNSIAYTVKLEK